MLSNDRGIDLLEETEEQANSNKATEGLHDNNQRHNRAPATMSIGIQVDGLLNLVSSMFLGISVIVVY